MAKAKKVVKLLGCPFCGAKPHMPEPMPFYQWDLHCLKCWLSVKGNTEEECLKRWNKRKGQDKVYEYRIKRRSESVE